jgi:2-amino-4-hydroxy-6-hydroxymethyldihydropteridine diphosphokinase
VTQPQPITAFIALGANLGDRATNIERALDALRNTEGVGVLRVSGLLENPAVGGPETSPPFLNAVAELRTALDPSALLRRLLDIEREMGRVRTQKWAPRLIDLDLILYSDWVIDNPDLQLPHPRFHERRFVLQPLEELAPHLQHPVLKRTVRELLQQLRAEQIG